MNSDITSDFGAEVTNICNMYSLVPNKKIIRIEKNILNTISKSMKTYPNIPEMRRPTEKG